MNGVKVAPKKVIAKAISFIGTELTNKSNNTPPVQFDVISINSDKYFAPAASLLR